MVGEAILNMKQLRNNVGLWWSDARKKGSLLKTCCCLPAKPASDFMAALAQALRTSATTAGFDD